MAKNNGFAVGRLKSTDSVPILKIDASSINKNFDYTDPITQVTRGAIRNVEAIAGKTVAKAFSVLALDPSKMLKVVPPELITACKNPVTHATGLVILFNTLFGLSDKDRIKNLLLYFTIMRGESGGKSIPYDEGRNTLGQLQLKRYWWKLAFQQGVKILNSSRTATLAASLAMNPDQKAVANNLAKFSNMQKGIDGKGTGSESEVTMNLGYFYLLLIAFHERWSFTTQGWKLRPSYKISKEATAYLSSCTEILKSQDLGAALIVSAMHKNGFACFTSRTPVDLKYKESTMDDVLYLYKLIRVPGLIQYFGKTGGVKVRAILATMNQTMGDVSDNTDPDDAGSAVHINTFLGSLFDIPYGLFSLGNGELKSEFGQRILHNKTENHPGRDYRGDVGQPIFAPANATVLNVSANTYPYTGYGNTAVLRSLVGGQDILLAHASNLFISEGMDVKKGDIIGLVGQSGKVTGPHIHVEARKIIKGSKTASGPKLPPKEWTFSGADTVNKKGE